MRLIESLPSLSTSTVEPVLKSTAMKDTNALKDLGGRQIAFITNDLVTGDVDL